MARNTIGLFTSVFAESGDRTEFGAFATGWDAAYSNPTSGKYPERVAFNDLFAKLTALGVDVNQTGATLEWDTNLSYKEYALVTATDGVVYESLSAANVGHNPVSSPTFWKVAYSSPEDLAAHIADLANPHAVTKTQVGLDQADNTSDANKPVSTDQQTALDLKVDESDEGYTITAPSGGDVKTFDPDTASLGEALDFIATMAGTLKAKGVI